jgi:hypothetical protein
VDVDDALASHDQLLGQQLSQAGGVLHGPGPLREVCCPAERALKLGRSGSHFELGQALFFLVDCHRSV